MAIGTTHFGNLDVSRLIIGGNPFSGFSHQNPDRDYEMRHYFTTDRLKETLRNAESLGLRTVISRADHHIMRMLLEFWDDGGTLQWIAQTCTELGETRNGVRNAIRGNAGACYVHGGRMDFLLAQNMLDEAVDAVAMIHDAGMPAGVAGHNPRVFEWAEEHLDVDFYMCSYYNPTPRDQRAEYVAGMQECFDDADRDAMVRTIRQLSKPAIHYKVLAAGRKTPQEALSFVAQHLRSQDAVCIGIFPKDNANMLTEDLTLLDQYLTVEGKIPICC